ncbi:MAG: hypothetical protein ACLUHE_04745 [Christensenellales bacterium]
MHETGVLNDEGLMGDGEYDEDDAFEAPFAALTDGVEDDGEIGKTAQMLDGIHGRTAGILWKQAA